MTLKHVRTLVLDEADRMLDMGFKPAVDRIVKQLPRERQTLFFSATLEGAAGKLAESYTHDARTHVNAPKRDPKAFISHRFVQAPSQAAKVDLLVDELAHEERGRTLVFVRTKRGADRLIKKLRAHKVDAVAMHGDKSQSQRQKALARFDRGDVTVLVATDVAARGIDVPDVTHVINFDVPEDGDTYTHRVGRTGRAGSSGHGVSFVLGDQAHEMRAVAAGLGLAKEFDRREGREHGPATGATGPPPRRRRTLPRTRPGSRPRRARAPTIAASRAVGDPPARAGRTGTGGAPPAVRVRARAASRRASRGSNSRGRASRWAACRFARGSGSQAACRFALGSGSQAARQFADGSVTGSATITAGSSSSSPRTATRSLPSAERSSRETCICETPISSPISRWVIPAWKR